MTLKVASTSAVRRARPSQPLVKLSNVSIEDPGFRAKVTATSITLSGKARGPRDVDAYGRDRGSDYERVQTVTSGLGVDFDRDRMPQFDTSRGFTAKNAWVFAHSMSVSTKTGQTPKQALEALAKKIAATSGYQPKVVTHRDGSATLTIERR